MRKSMTTGVLMVCMGLLSGVFALSGCAPAYEHPELICIHEMIGNDSPRVAIYSSTYRDARQKTDTPHVTVIWDGREVFNDHLPYRHPDYYPRELIGHARIRLMQIETWPGQHALEVIHDGQSNEHVIQLEDNDFRGFRLYHDVETGQIILIDDNSPWI